MLALDSVQTSEEELDTLLLRTGRGDREAFARLYGLSRGAVYGLALALLHDAQEAQDVSQDVFVKVWESAPSYRPQGTPMAWLDEESWNAIPAGEPGVSAEDRLLLQEGLGRLGEEERYILLLHAGGLKHREIAALLELPLSTVLSKYHRGLKKMRAQMKGEDRKSVV